MAIRTATVLTHRRPSETAGALGALVETAVGAGAVLRLDPEETRKHELTAAPGLELDAELRLDVDICFAMGGDGTILTALRTYAGTGVPVFAVNFGEIGFLGHRRVRRRPGGLRARVRGGLRRPSPPGHRVLGVFGPLAGHQ